MSGRPGPRSPLEHAVAMVELLHRRPELRDLAPIPDAIDQAVRQNA